MRPWRRSTSIRGPAARNGRVQTLTATMRSALARIGTSGARGTNASPGASPVGRRRRLRRTACGRRDRRSRTRRARRRRMRVLRLPGSDDVSCDRDGMRGPAHIINPGSCHGRSGASDRCDGSDRDRTTPPRACRRDAPLLQRVAQVAHRRRVVRLQRVVARREAGQRRQRPAARDEAQDRRRVVGRVVDVTLLGERRDDQRRNTCPGPSLSPFGGATWSHTPPNSSYVMTISMCAYCGLACSFATRSAMCASPSATFA